MKVRSVLLFLASTMIVSTGIAVVFWPEIFPPPTLAIPTPTPSWQLVPRHESKADNYVLIPDNGNCEVLMPNDSMVTIPHDCNVVMNDCPLTISGTNLQAQCESLIVDASAVSLNSSFAQATPVLPIYGTATPVSVDCTGYIFHTIRSGDTLWDIARSYQVDLEMLMAFNGLNQWDAEHLNIGYPICIPLAR